MANIIYQKSESMSVQGTWQSVKRRYGNSWHISEQGNGNGNWLLTRHADILVNGISCRNRVLTYYGKTRLSENLAYQFATDVKQGRIDLNDFLR